MDIPVDKPVDTRGFLGVAVTSSNEIDNKTRYFIENHALEYPSDTYQYCL